MNILNPQIIEKEGRKEFVVLSYEEFLALKESLEDYQDLKDLREAKSEEKEKPTVPLSKLREEFLAS